MSSENSDKVEASPAEPEFPWKQGLAMTLIIYLALRGAGALFKLACSRIGERFGISPAKLVSEFWIFSIAPVLILSIWVFWCFRDKSSCIRLHEAVRMKKIWSRSMWPSPASILLMTAVITAGRIAYITIIDSKVRSPAEWLSYSLQISSAVLAAPFIEEIYYRGLLNNALCQVFIHRGKGKIAAQTWALLWSSVFFGVGHPAGTIQITISGLIFGVAYRFSGNLWVPIFCHAIMNLMAMEYWITHGLI